MISLEKIRTIAIKNPRQRMHISLIFRRNKLLAMGTNHGKMHPEALRKGYTSPYLHSELDAFRKIRFQDHKNLTLINYRFTITGKTAMSMPCPICMMWCKEVFNKIYYTNREGILTKL